MDSAVLVTRAEGRNSTNEFDRAHGNRHDGIYATIFSTCSDVTASGALWECILGETLEHGTRVC
jgi:hypothetical protein